MMMEREMKGKNTCNFSWVFVIWNEFGRIEFALLCNFVVLIVNVIVGIQRECFGLLFRAIIVNFAQ